MRFSMDCAVNKKTIATIGMKFISISAILFGIPSNLIEGILVGRKYEKDENILKEIKKLLPDCYICNLDGNVIMV